jgi:hypothetical protein
MARTSSFSPRWKNMPLLVRSALPSSPPVLVATVAERASPRLATAISASHSSSESRPPNTTTRGCVHDLLDCNLAIRRHRGRGADSSSAGSGTGTDGGSPWPGLLLQVAAQGALHRLDGDVLVQPEAIIAFSTDSAHAACGLLHDPLRSSGYLLRLCCLLQHGSSCA